MSITTYQLTVDLLRPDGSAIANAPVTAALTKPDISGVEGQISKATLEADSDSSGAAVFNLWPNTKGTHGSQYRIRAIDPETGAKLVDATVTMPEKDCHLRDILMSPAPTPKPYDEASIAAILNARTDAGNHKADAEVAANAAASSELQAADKAADAAKSAAAAVEAKDAARLLKESVTQTALQAEEYKVLIEADRRAADQAKGRAADAEAAAVQNAQDAKEAQVAASASKGEARAARNDSIAARDASQHAQVVAEQHEDAAGVHAQTASEEAVKAQQSASTASQMALGVKGDRTAISKMMEDAKAAAGDAKEVAGLETVDDAVGRQLPHALTAALSGRHPPGETHKYDALSQQEAAYLVNSDQFENFAEILRGLGQSGVFMCRQYERGGAYALNRPFDATYSALSSHSHWDAGGSKGGICGLGEISVIVNGQHIRTRHNDFRLRQSAPATEGFLHTVPIDMPDVPLDVVGTVEQQIDKMRDYFKVVNGEASLFDAGISEENYAAAFKWGLAYIEVWLEKFTEEVDDTFFSGRHVVDASNIRDLLKKVLYFNASGHKNRLENISYFSSFIRMVDDEGVPQVATLKYRIVVQPVGSLQEFPISAVLEPLEDLKTRVRTDGMSDEEFLNSRYQRFKVRQKLGESDDFSNVTHSLMDTLMERVPGLDGAGANLEETYDQYGTSETLMNWQNEPLNSAYYNRAYKLQVRDASNRQAAKRGFNDPTLFVAKTTRSNVVAVDGMAFSYALPLELILLSPLDKWNPYGVADITGTDNISQYQPGGSDGWGKTADKPIPGYADESLLYYHTPLAFYGDASVPDKDPADTALDGVYMRCSDGKSRLHTPSGMPIFLPKISGMSAPVRTRYFIYESFHEGSHAYAELQAYKYENALRFSELQAQITSLTLQLQEKSK